MSKDEFVLELLMRLIEVVSFMLVTLIEAKPLDLNMDFKNSSNLLRAFVHMLPKPNLRVFGFLSRHFYPHPCLYSTSAFGFKLSKKSCIRYLLNCNSLNQLKQIQTQILRLGLGQDPDALNKLVAFCADPSHGHLNYAEKVFSFIGNPNLFVYNVMIKGLVKTGRFRQAIFLFEKLREDQLWPDSFTYPFVLKAIGCLGEVLKGEKIHCFVVKTGMDFDNYVCNSLMDMYGELGIADCARKLFEKMPIRDSISWNVHISGYVRNRRFEEAVDVFRRMKMESNEKPDEATVVSTLSACTALRNLELGKEIHSYVRDKLGFTTIISNSLLDLYAKCGHMIVARKIFDEMTKKNVICWTSIISGYINCGNLEEARELFERSPVKDLVLWTAMINGYVQFNHFDQAVSLFRKMQIEKVKADKFTIVSLLTGCAQVGALEQGKWIHGYLKENKIQMDAIVGTGLVEMYAKCGSINKSLEIFYALKGKDTASWTSIICGLAANGKTIKALELFSEMEREGTKPDDITFIGVLSACSHGGLVELGRRFFDSMKEKYRIEPKIEHYGCLIDLLGRAGLLEEAERLIGEIPNENNENIIPLYGALLSACRIHGNVEMGEQVARRLVGVESTDSSVHTLLANIYAHADRWKDVTKVRQKMRELGVRKTPGCSSIEVDGIVYEFVVGDYSHPEITKVCSMLDKIAGTLVASEENFVLEHNRI